MPKVLRIINRFNLGGPTYNAALLTKHLAPEFETLLIGGEIEPDEEGSDHIVEALGIEAIKVKELRRSVNPLKDYKALKKIKSIISDFQPDIVHTHASKAGAVGRTAAHQLGVKNIVHTFHGHVFHSYFSDTKSKVYQKIERDLAAKSSAIVAISDIQKDELVNQYNICNASQTHVIPLGFDLSKFQLDQVTKRGLFRKEMNLEDDEIAVGIIGRLAPIKNHEQFIRGFNEVAKQNDRLRGFIIGDGELSNSLKQLAADLGILERLKFTSWIKDIDIPLAGLDVLALTSKNEGTPVSIIEAKAAGKAVISSNVGGVADIISDGISGILYNSSDFQSFTEKLSRLCSDSTFRASLAQSGVSEVRSKYQYQRLCSDMAHLYNSLLNR